MRASTKSSETLGTMVFRLGTQYVKFGFVGGAATATHVGMFAGLIEIAGIAPLLANFLAFCAAFGVSFLGHYCWTFAGIHAPYDGQLRMDRTLRRFLAVALFGLGLNSLAVYVVTDTLTLSYGYAIVIMVSIVPVVLFAINKYWAFAGTVHD